MTMMAMVVRKVVLVAARVLALVDVVAVAQAIATMVAPPTAGMVATVGRSNKSCIEEPQGHSWFLWLLYQFFMKIYGKKRDNFHCNQRLSAGL